MKTIIGISLLYLTAVHASGQDAKIWTKGQSPSIDMEKAELKISLLEFTTNDVVVYDADNQFHLDCSISGLAIEIKKGEGETLEVTICSQSKPLKLDGNQLGLTSGDGTLTINYKGPGAVIRGDADPDTINIIEDVLSLSNPANAEIIMKKYSIDSTNKPIWTDLKNLMGLNSVGKSQSFSNSKLANVEVTSIVDGFAKHIVNQVKQELSIAFFERFKEAINDEKYKEFGTLFPEVKRDLLVIDEQIYDLKPYLNGIRISAHADLKAFPQHLPDLLSEGYHLRTLLDSDKNALYGVAVGFGLAKSLDANRNFGKALETLSIDSKIKNSADSKLKNSIELLRLISFSLKSPRSSDSTYYVRKKDILELTENPTLFKYYTGLLIAYCKLKNQPVPISDAIASELTSAIKDTTSTLTKNIVYNFAKSVDLWEGISSKKEQNEKIIGYFEAIQQTFNGAENIGNVFGAGSDFKKLIEKSQTGLEILKLLYTKNYVSAVAQTAHLYSETFAKVSGPGSDQSKAKLFVRKFRTYATFIVQISQSDTSDEIAAILEQYAAPVGSYRDKKIYRFSLAIDSFVGVGAGWSSEKDTLGNTVKNNSLWINTPIGVSLNWSFTNWLSLTLMPSLFDIGPLVSYRFLNSDGEVSKIYLKEIVSPGVFASLGFGRKFPIFFNVGYQKPAYLGKVTSAGNSYNLKPYGLLSASATVNIPLFNLYRK